MGSSRSEDVADNGVLTDAERRDAVARLMSRITTSRISGPFSTNFPEEFGRHLYVGLQPRQAGAADAPEFVEPDQAYDLSGLTLEFIEETTRPRGYVDIPAPGDDVIARERVSLHWAEGTVSLEEGALAMVRPELPERTMSADLAAAGNAVSSFFTGAGETVSTAWTTVTDWFA
ncbi:MAG TPA: hypothetical protein VFX30_07425 [bacterium]|nr:hypothetical protein [bacterium]